MVMVGRSERLQSMHLQTNVVLSEVIPVDSNKYLARSKQPRQLDRNTFARSPALENAYLPPYTGASR